VHNECKCSEVLLTDDADNVQTNSPPLLVKTIGNVFESLFHVVNYTAQKHPMDSVTHNLAHPGKNRFQRGFEPASSDAIDECLFFGQKVED
jgi:hypothetical protein